MGKGFFYGLVVAAPVLAIILSVALEKDEQTRAERAELQHQIQMDSARFDAEFYGMRGSDEFEADARSRLERLQAQAAEKRQRVVEAEKAAEESMTELQAALNDSGEIQKRENKEN